METKTAYRTWGTSRGARLPTDLYPSNHPVHVVVGTHRRRAWFQQEAAAEILFEIVAQHPRTLAACVMPDHLHWLIDTPERLSWTVSRLKSFATRSLRRARLVPSETPIWQRSFWDRVVRASDDLRKTVDYLVHNPVRAGLVESWEEYPWSVVRMDRLAMD